MLESNGEQTVMEAICKWSGKDKEKERENGIWKNQVIFSNWKKKDPNLLLILPEMIIM